MPIFPPLLAGKLRRRSIRRTAQAHQGLRPDGAVRGESLSELKLFDLARHGLIEHRVSGGFRCLALDLCELLAQPFHIRPAFPRPDILARNRRHAPQQGVVP